MDFFCQSIIEGIPLRGCISTGIAMMDQYKSIYFGNPLVEAARGEPAQNTLGVAFGKSLTITILYIINIIFRIWDTLKKMIIKMFF